MLNMGKSVLIQGKIKLTWYLWENISRGKGASSLNSEEHSWDNNMLQNPEVNFIKLTLSIRCNQA